MIGQNTPANSLMDRLDRSASSGQPPCPASPEGFANMHDVDARALPDLLLEVGDGLLRAQLGRAEALQSLDLGHEPLRVDTLRVVARGVQRQPYGCRLHVRGVVEEVGVGEALALVDAKIQHLDGSAADAVDLDAKCSRRQGARNP